MDSYKSDSIWVNIQNYLPLSNRLTESVMPEEYYVTFDDSEIHIDHYQPAVSRGRVIIFHGVGGNGRLLSLLAVPLMKHGFEVICPDLPLYGYTRCSKTVTYATWVSCGTEIVKHYQQQDALPTFLFGLSAGGMLAYQVACECVDIKGLMVSCILDQRNKAVIRSAASNPFFGFIAKPLLAAANTFAGNVKIPMKWIGNMKAIANNEELVALLLRDKKSSGTLVPLAFLHSMLNPIISVEPEAFETCPVLLVHPGDDHWTDIKLSNLFFERLAVSKKTVILEGAGHMPIEEIGLRKMETACVTFLEEQINS